MDAKSPSDESARTALFLLSETISSYHADQWLADLLQSATRQELPVRSFGSLDCAFRK